MEEMTVELILFSLAMSVIGGLITLWIVYIYNKNRQAKLRTDREYLLIEKEVLQSMQKSSVQLNRISFRSVFAILVIFAFGFSVQAFEKLLYQSTPMNIAFRVIELGTFVICMFTAARCHKRYDHLKDMKSALDGLDKKIEKIDSKLK
jgi:Cu/Ag efflux pump CusA